MRKTTILVVVAVALVALVGAFFWPRLCRADLSQPAAERLLRSSDFEEARLWKLLVLYSTNLRTQEDLRHEHPELQDFIAAGLVTIGPNVVIVHQEIGAKVVLTPNGELAAASGWRRVPGPAGEDAWEVPLARRELLEVAAPVTSGNRAACDASWRWVPTELGRFRGIPDGTMTARLEFARAGCSWTLERFDSGYLPAGEGAK